MPCGRLRHAEQGIDFRVDSRQGSANAQDAKESRRRRLAQRFLRFLPDSLGDERVHFVTLDHAAHQFDGGRRDPEAQRREACGETCDPQHAHRIFDERVGDMAQHSGLEIGDAAVGIDQRTVRRPRDCIDRQIAPREVLFEGDSGAEFHRESAVAGGDFAFEPCERIFFVRIGMQKHREIAAYFAIVHPQQIFARSAYDDPVSFAHRKPEQAVSNRSANEIHLHA